MASLCMVANCSSGYLHCLLFLVLFFLADILILILTLFSAHVGYLHLVNTLDKCSSSCCSSWGLEQIVLTLWWRVPTHYILMRWYDGYPIADMNLYRLVSYRQLCWACYPPWCYQHIQKSMDPSDLESSLVNWIWWVKRVYMVQKLLFESSFNDYKGVIYKSLPHQRMVWLCVYGSDLKVLHI